MFSLLFPLPHFTGHPHFFMSWHVSAARVIHLLMIFCLSRTIKVRESRAFLFILNCVYTGWPNSAFKWVLWPAYEYRRLWVSCEGILPLTKWPFFALHEDIDILCPQKEGGDSSSIISVKSELQQLQICCKYIADAHSKTMTGTWYNLE